MRVRLIRLGSLITLYNGIYAIVYGFLILIFHQIILAEYFRRVPVPWSIFSKSFPYRGQLYISLLLTHAFFLISLGIFIIYLSFFILKRKDKLAWVILFSSGIVSWASLFIINVIMGSIINITLSFIGWVSFVAGMIIPIKYYIRKEYPEF
jgi:hypothetical protein